MSEKNKILVVAPEVPARDRSSGELRLFTILGILSEKYHVVLLALNARGADEDAKYKRDLEETGIEVLVKDFSFKEILAKHRFSAAFIEFYFTAGYCLNNIRILQPQCPIIIDSVDIHFYREKLKYGITQDRNDLRRSEETEKRELAAYQKADLVIAVTREDADVVKEKDPTVVFDIIPNIHPIMESRHEGKDRDLLVFVGGFKHQPNVDAVKYFCEEVFPLVRQQRPRMRLQVIGSGASEELKRLGSDHVQFLGFVPSVTPCLHQSYISVAPLRFGAGMKGKIGEAMAHGLPVVTTSIGIQGLDLKHGENIMLGDTPGKFADSILKLATDEQLYARISKNGMDYIKARFTPETVREEIFRILENIKSRPVKKISAPEKLRFLTQYAMTRYTPGVYAGVHSRSVPAKKEPA